MERYEPQYAQPQMERDKEGQWVRFGDIKEILNWMLDNSDHTTKCSEQFNYKCVCTCGLSNILEVMK